MFHLAPFPCSDIMCVTDVDKARDSGEQPTALRDQDDNACTLNSKPAWSMSNFLRLHSTWCVNNLGKEDFNCIHKVIPIPLPFGLLAYSLKLLNRFCRFLLI